MNKEDFEHLLEKVSPYETILSVDDLHDKSDRTLLMGDYGHFRWHVYLKNKKIRVADYEGYSLIERFVESNLDFAPNSYTFYPEYCDYEFCKLLIERGVDMEFEEYEPVSKEEQFYGKVLEVW